MSNHLRGMMFTVTLLRRTPRTGAGIGRYGDKAEKAIIAHGAKCENIFCSFTKRTGILRAIKENIIDPLVLLINSNDSEICHATEEYSGIYLPLARGKKVLTFHHVTTFGEDVSGFFGYMLWKLAASVAVRSSDVIIAVSTQTRDEIVAKYKLDPKKVETLSFEIGKQFRKLEDTERSKIVGCVSSLIPRKNIAALIRSFEKIIRMPGMSDVKLKICGKGSERDDMIKLVKELDIEENVEFLSDITDEEIVRLYNSVSAVVLPSYHEGLGLSLIEAQRCHTPVLYFKGARIPEEVTRYAVPCAGEEEMSEQLYRCLSDETYRDSVADAAFGYANEFGEDFKERLIDIYEKLLR